MPATGGSEEPAAPVPSTVPPDSEQVVLTEEDEIAELGAVPTAADPDRVAEDEAADEGDLQPRQFLGAGGDGLGGAEEPVNDDALPAEVSVSTAPASTPAATGCTPKAWQAKNLPAFKDKDNLTEEFLQHFEPFPKPKATPWAEQPANFRNTEQCDEEPQPTGPDWDPDCKGGLNMKFWHGMKAHGHDHERPTAKEIMDPLWLLFVFLPIEFWRNLANMSDNYQHQVYTRMQAADVAAGKDVVRRGWEKLFEAGRWSKLVHFFGILVYRGAVKTGDKDHGAAWSTAGYKNNHGVYDEQVAACMSLVEFEQMRRFVHFCDNDAEAERHARDHRHRDYMPTQRMDPLLDALNGSAARLFVVCDRFAIDEITGGSSVFGPRGFMKRTPGKKVSQGFQALAACSKIPVKFKTRTGQDDSRGVVMCHAFLWDLTQGNLKLLDPHMNITCNVVLRLVHMTVCRDNEPIRKNLDLFMDNRFAQARLLVLLLASMHVYCTCTIRMNFFPLAKDLRKKMIPPAWEGKAINDQNKAAFRQQAANLCSFMCLTMVICFDVGLTRMITSRQNMDMQRQCEYEKRRRTFLDLIVRMKYALCRLYTDWMDPVDITDHHRVMNGACCC